MALHPDITRKDDASLALDVANTAVALASRQQTRNAGSVTIPNADGTSTVLGVQAGDATVARFVGDTTAPGTPTGVTANSAASMIFILWDGTLDGGVPSDFHHVALLVDGVEVAELAGRGSYACGPYDNGSEHIVTAISYDDAHDATGESTPNRSAPSTAITVTVQGSDIDPSALGITVTKTAAAPTDTDKGANRGDLWLQYDRDPTATGATLTAEWWWNGAAWDPIPVAVYLDQLAARGITADNAVIGLLSAGIIQSGTFRTAETGARVEIDANGVTAYDANGNTTFQLDAMTGAVTLIGALQTGPEDSARFKISQSNATNPNGGNIVSTGTIDWYPAATTDPAMRIAGFDNETTNSLSMGTIDNSTSVRIDRTNTVAGVVTLVQLFADTISLMESDAKAYVEVGGKTVSLYGSKINVNSVDFTPEIYTDPTVFLTWRTGYSNYSNRTWMYHVGGMIVLSVFVSGTFNPTGDNGNYTSCATIKTGFYPKQGINGMFVGQGGVTGAGFIGGPTDPTPGAIYVHMASSVGWAGGTFIFPESLA